MVEYVVLISILEYHGAKILLVKKMTQRTFDIFINKFYSRPPGTNHINNKIFVYLIDDTRSLDIVDSKGFGPGNKKGYRYVLVVVDKFGMFGWRVL